MIKVTMNAKNAEHTYGAESTYLIETDNHVAAVRTAAVQFDKDHAESEEWTITRITTATETSVLSPLF